MTQKQRRIKEVIRMLGQVKNDILGIILVFTTLWTSSSLFSSSAQISRQENLFLIHVMRLYYPIHWGIHIPSHFSNKATELYTLSFIKSLHKTKACRYNIAVLLREEACGHETEWSEANRFNIIFN